MLVGQIKGGTALPPVPQAGILFPLVPGIRECSVTLLCSFSSLPDSSLCFGTSKYLVMSNASSQMALSPHWCPSCCQLLYGLIVNVTNFMFFVYSNLDGESYYTGVCLKFVFSSWSFLSMKLWATWEAFSQAPHEKHKQGLKVCIHCPSPSWTRLFPTSCLGASGGSCDIWIKLCNNNIDWSVFLVKVARLSCSVNTLSSCCYNLTF